MWIHQRRKPDKNMFLQKLGVGKRNMWAGQWRRLMSALRKREMEAKIELAIILLVRWPVFIC